MSTLTPSFLTGSPVEPAAGPCYWTGPFRTPSHRHPDWDRLEAVAHHWFRDRVATGDQGVGTAELRRAIEAELTELELGGDFPVPGATGIGVTVWSESPGKPPTRRQRRETASAQWKVIMRRLIARPCLAVAFLRQNRPDIYDRVTDTLFAEALSSPPGASAQKPRISRQEANVKARVYLRKHPDATVRELKEAIGCSQGLASQLPAWQAVLEIRTKPRKAKAAKEVALTDKMKAVIGSRKADPAEQVATDEILQKLIEQAEPDEQARLENLTPDQRRDLATEVAAQDEEATRLGPLDPAAARMRPRARRK